MVTAQPLHDEVACRQSRALWARFEQARGASSRRNVFHSGKHEGVTTMTINFDEILNQQKYCFNSGFYLVSGPIWRVLFKNQHYFDQKTIFHRFWWPSFHAPKWCKICSFWKTFAIFLRAESTQIDVIFDFIDAKQLGEGSQIVSAVRIG